MFLRPPAQTICGPQYIKCERGAEFQMNAIPIRGNGQMYFPRPFLILGICRSPIEDMPDNGASEQVAYWPMVFSEPDDPAQQGAAADMCFDLFFELALSTMREYENPGFIYPVNYIEPYIQAKNYRGYFTQYLSDPANVNPEQWLNLFLMAPSLIKKWQELNEGATVIDWTSSFQNFVRFIEKNADQRMYGAPGLYNVTNANSQYEWLFNNSYEQYPDL